MPKTKSPSKEIKLVIVESPTKAKTISRFLGKQYRVESSYGHIRDLPKSKLGIDLEKNFEPQYVIPRKAGKVVKTLKEASKKASAVILATDEDREGEAIAWHLTKALDISDKKVERIVFHEITDSAIKKALENPRQIDQNLVSAQQARRVLDRLVGYKLSPFLWKKIMKGLSAGRVQSVALRLIVERELEIRKFVPEEYWTISALLQKIDCQKDECVKFLSDLSIIDEKPIDKPGLKDKKQAQEILADLGNAKWSVESVEKKTVEKQPRPPFTTSTLQQEAWSRLRFSAKKTMTVAQQLYEGINIKKEGQIGLITYMRTDSVNMAEEALAAAARCITSDFGEKYYAGVPRRFKTSSKSSQEAHEAIRPTHPELSPESAKSDLTREQYALYDIIWRRFIASQMAAAVFDNTTINASAKSRQNYTFKSAGQIRRFEGFMKIYSAASADTILPDVGKDDLLSAEEIKPEQHQTEPPPRYTEASLIKALEKFGIGRPSTYAPTLSTIQDRGYVNKNESKSFVPTEIGEKVNEILVENFPQIVDIDFTATMEEDLDKIASGEKDWQPAIRKFYEPFEKILAEKYETVEKRDMTQPTEEKCEKCGKPMIIRYGRFGKFMACSGFPECKTTKPLPTTPLGIKCPKCETGDVIMKKTRTGRFFYGCSKYPECDFAVWQKPTGKLCIECGSPLVELKSGVKCSNKTCNFRESNQPKKQ